MKLASAVNAAAGIADGAIATDAADIVVSDGAFQCSSTVQGALDSEVVAQAADLELKLMVADAAGTGLGGKAYSTFQSGSLVVCQVCYWFDDVAPSLDNTIQPNTIEAGQTK
jgi:hypothetical protein